MDNKLDVEVKNIRILWVYKGGWMDREDDDIDVCVYESVNI